MFRLPTIEPEADVRIRGKKKGANRFVYVVLIPIGGAGITFGSNKVRNNPRHCVNPPHPIPDPRKFPAFPIGVHGSFKLNMCFLKNAVHPK